MTTFLWLAFELSNYEELIRITNKYTMLVNGADYLFFAVCVKTYNFVATFYFIWHLNLTVLPKHVKLGEINQK